MDFGFGSANPAQCTKGLGLGGAKAAQTPRNLVSGTRTWLNSFGVPASEARIWRNGVIYNGIWLPERDSGVIYKGPWLPEHDFSVFCEGSGFRIEYLA